MLKWYHPIVLIVTWFTSGLVPKARGTSGSFFALPVAYIIQTELGMVALCAATILAFFVGWWASHIYMHRNNRMDDPGEIVIDEVAGMWLTIAAMPLMWLGPTQETILYVYIAAFFAFRFFDIVKPWPVSWADRKIKGALGVMLDDILAAIYALATLGFAGHVLSYLGMVSVRLTH
ncbi:MAG: phosphatidylglycerophosphatase A [Rickettsiales bacterium]|nr:phosphatidylglycerophosphatase A [Rickettsiales bacterium]